MPETVNLLMREFLDWIACRPRTYGETMEAWRSSCPRQTIWEDAWIEGLIQMEGGSKLNDSVVRLTQRGEALLAGVQ